MWRSVRALATVLVPVCAVTWVIRGVLISDAVPIEIAQAEEFREIVLLNRYDFFPGRHRCSHLDAVAANITAIDPRAMDARGRRGVERAEYVVCVSWPFRGSNVKAR